MKKFEIPAYYRSPITGKIKELRRLKDLRKQDFSPTLLDFGPVQFYIARHFGFCYGVENAIEISYRAIEENLHRRVFLLSQMIHNQEVNNDLQSRGIKFIMDTDGRQFIPWSDLKPDDVVIIPAFGTTVEIENLLLDKGLEVQKYNTTCPFVEKVWNRSEKLSLDHYSIIIHGKPKHEETRATFSHSARRGPSLVLRDMSDAISLGDFIRGSKNSQDFLFEFAGKYTEGFNPEKDLQRIGVVNQTTMLATETQAIADYLRAVMVQKYGLQNIAYHFADTRDTLCYATNDNQDATYELLKTDADFALVVGGYNSSNTSHIVELCERKFPTYFINSDQEIKSRNEIHHFNFHEKKKVITENFIPEKDPVRIVLTSGASCPDTLVDRVLLKTLSFFENSKSVENLLQDFERKI
ncbi:4-hydroxy-3-methylbut-2-enyl diphosphate reductase [Chryseolinea sp. H1M3-3]|uniref:4-hydroxy-3-methylbut-2-enyl diphosphate reductase n=1 Tax=Chryseolinea sp. H1M3-3 TaxID=3034144 RepID=UPI0023EC3240|nr:4-hydroxy-3-methylbut-2-enyl diphosphate reductase [Chryseolinea sp. H1M3-3]